MRKFTLLVAAICGAWLAAGSVLGQVTIPYSFNPGSTISSTQVNSNFSALGSAALNRTGGTMTGTLTSQAILPASNNSYDLGSSSFKFKDVYMAGTLTIPTLTPTSALGVAYGGTALTATPSNGQLAIGNGTNYTLATLTAGIGIGVTNASGAITIKQTSATVTLTDGATPALDASLGFTFRLSAAGDRTIAVPSNATASQRLIIQHFASGGARTLALNTGAGGFRFGTDITALTQTASGKTDYVYAVYNDTDSKWDVVGYVKGF